MRQKGCHVIQAEGDADVDIVKAAVSMSLYRSTTLIGEDTDLLVLLLYHATTDCKDLYFRSDKGKANVYNIKVLKCVLSDDVCADLLFAHASSGCDTTSRIFGVGKKSGLQKIIKRESVFCNCAKIFCSPKADQVAVETAGCQAMISLFNGKQSDSLASLRYSYLCKKVATARTLVTPERLPPTVSAANFHSRRTYLQVMVWMGRNEGMEPTDWGWTKDIQGGQLIPVMMNTSPAPDILLKMVHCNYSTGCSSFKCSCKKHGLDCSISCGLCQEGNCDNMTYELVSDEDSEV